LRATVDRCVDGWALLLLLALCLVAPASIADQIIPAGGRTVVSNGLFDLACTDLSVGGVLDTGSGMYVNVRNVTVAPSGIIQGGGSIHYSGTLTINGTVQPGVRPHRESAVQPNLSGATGGSDSDARAFDDRCPRAVAALAGRFGNACARDAVRPQGIESERTTTKRGQTRMVAGSVQ
jgi:hypothetical protein